MTHRVGHFENSFFTQQRFDFVACNDVPLFQRFYCKIFTWKQKQCNWMQNEDEDSLQSSQSIWFTSFLVLRQYDFAKVAASQYAEQTKRVHCEASWRRKLWWWLTSRFIRTILVLQSAHHLWPTFIRTGSCGGCCWRRVANDWLLLLLLERLIRYIELWCRRLLHYWRLWNILSIVRHIQIVKWLYDLCDRRIQHVISLAFSDFIQVWYTKIQFTKSNYKWDAKWLVENLNETMGHWANVGWHFESVQKIMI